MLYQGFLMVQALPAQFMIDIYICQVIICCSQFLMGILMRSMYLLNSRVFIQQSFGNYAANLFLLFIDILPMHPMGLEPITSPSTLP